MQDVQEEPLFVQRVAGLDIAKAEVEVTIRVPSDTSPDRRQQETRAFGTTRRQLLDLADWLRGWGVTKVGMEATSDYWKPVFFLLESKGFNCELYNAGQVKALPGRPKTDRADSIWLAKITERGMICSSFVPPEPIRRLRTHTRYRCHLTQARTAEKQRVEKLLEDGHLKLSSVISDIHGVSGRDMLDALGYRGLARQFPGQVTAPPLKPRKDAPPGKAAAWEESRKQQSSERICVEHANAEHKQWRPLQRYTGRREYYEETHLAIAGLVSDRAARR